MLKPVFNIERFLDRENMDTKRILIVEDEENSIIMLEKVIRQLETDKEIIIYKATGKSEAYEILHEHLIDVFLIDIVLVPIFLGDVSGIKLAEEIREIDRYKFTPIVFITSLEDPKMYAFKELHSYDYIVKPYMVTEVLKTVESALNYTTRPKKEQIITFRKDGILFPIPTKDIVYIKAKGHTLYVFGENDSISIPYRSCREMNELLDNEKFVQCNRGTIINRECIMSIDKVNNYVMLKENSGDKLITIGKKYLEKILEGMM